MGITKPERKKRMREQKKRMKEKNREEMEKGFIGTWGLVSKPEIALSCMTEHEPPPHTGVYLCLFVCVCVVVNGYNVQVNLCVLICLICAISVSLTLQSNCAYVFVCVCVWVWICASRRMLSDSVCVLGHCVSIEGWRGTSALSQWSDSADGDRAVSQRCWTVACLTTQTRWKDERTHMHTHPHTSSHHRTYHLSSNLQKAQTSADRLKDHADSRLSAAHNPSVPFMHLMLCWSVTVAKFHYDIQHGMSYVTEMENYINHDDNLL